MPHLQFELNFPVKKEEKGRFARAIVGHFSRIMDTGTDHIGITLRTYAPEDLHFGRAAPSGGRTAFVNADIRTGRTKEQKRTLALAFIDEIASTWGIAREAVYVPMPGSVHPTLSDALARRGIGQDVRELTEPVARVADRGGAAGAGGGHRGIAPRH